MAVMPPVERLHDGRFALYSEIHHALMDGVPAMRMLDHLERSLVELERIAGVA